jgi:hypothetical protein
VALDLLFKLHVHSDPSGCSAVLLLCLETRSSMSMLLIFLEIQSTITVGPGNSALFVEMVECVNTKVVEVAAGGVLSTIRHMLEEEKAQLFSMLNEDQTNFLSPFIQIEFRNNIGAAVELVLQNNPFTARPFLGMARFPLLLAEVARRTIR